MAYNGAEACFNETRNTDFFGWWKAGTSLQYGVLTKLLNNGLGKAPCGTKRAFDKEKRYWFRLSTSYDFDFGLSAGAAYSSSDRTDAQVGNGCGDGHRYWQLLMMPALKLPEAGP